MILYMGTVVGGTRYIQEWLKCVQKLKPLKIAVAKDASRSEALPEGLGIQVIEYDTKKLWESYEKRHAGWKSDESILVGIIILLEDFLKTDASHFMHIDSDVMLSDEAISKIISIEWDYLQFGIPVIPRELSPDQMEHWRRHVMMFWESTCFGLSKKLAEQVISPLKNILANPYPVDIKLHRIVKEQFYKSNNNKHLNIFNVKITHYIKGERITL